MAPSPTVNSGIAVSRVRRLRRWLWAHGVHHPRTRGERIYAIAHYLAAAIALVVLALATFTYLSDVHHHAHARLNGSHLVVGALCAFLVLAGLIVVAVARQRRRFGPDGRLVWDKRARLYVACVLCGPFLMFVPFTVAATYLIDQPLGLHR